MFLRNVLLSIAILFIPVLSSSQASAQTHDSNRAEAERLWELMIQAKGGRERLLAVNNVHSSTGEKYWRWLKRISFAYEGLFVFPDKSWEWDDQRGTVFGFTIRLHNFEKDLHLSYVERDHPGRVVGIIKPSTNQMNHLQLHLFAETKWIKPIPQSVRREKVGGRDVEIVKTRVEALPKDEQKVEFALDPNSHLPVQVIYYWTTKNNRELSGAISLSDYSEVDGIQMPSTIGRMKAKYQINVEYNEKVFDQPPSVNAGIDAWRKK